MSKQISGYRGSLDIFYQVEDSQGNFGAIYDGGNIVDFNLTPDADETEIIDTGNANYGQAADSMIDAKPTKYSMTVNRMNIDNWAVAFMGEYAARSAAQATILDHVVSAVQNEMFKLPDYDITIDDIMDDVDVVSYAEGTDFEIVDAALGIVKWLAADDDLHVDYTKAAETGYLLSGGTKTSKFLRVWGRGINRFNNKRCLVNISRSSVRGGGAFSFVGQDPSQMQLEGTIIVPSDGSAGFTIVTDE